LSKGQKFILHFLFLKTQTPTQTEKYVLFGGSKLIPGKSATTFKQVLFSVKRLFSGKKSFVLPGNYVCCSKKTFLTACQRFVWSECIKYVPLVTRLLENNLAGLLKFKICNGTDGAELWGGVQLVMRQSFMY
jgi:hypothetical protein